MKLLLDTANLEDIRYFNTYYPIVGVTTNPTILSKEGGDVLKLLRSIREIIGSERQLHVQVTESTYEKIVEEAEAIVAFLGENTFVKIPATDEGLRAVQTLSAKGYGITVTAVLTAAQALLASNAGAAYVAPYVSRLENICADGVGTVADIAEIFRIHGIKTEIISASIRGPQDVTDSAKAGAHIATIPYKVLVQMSKHPLTDAGIAKFMTDWNQTFQK